VLNRTNDLINLCQEVSLNNLNRENAVRKILQNVDRFWDKVRDTEQFLQQQIDTARQLQEPACLPETIREQQKDCAQMAQNTLPEGDRLLSQCEDLRRPLRQHCDTADHPELQKAVEDLQEQQQTLQKLINEHEKSLADQMIRATAFQDDLKKILQFLDGAETKLDALKPIAMTTEAVVDQLEEIRVQKGVFEPKQEQIHALNQAAHEIVTHSDEFASQPVVDALNGVNQRWEGLLDGCNQRAVSHCYN
jgi:hypothetical protein